MPKYDFNKVALQITLRHGCSPVTLLHIFTTSMGAALLLWKETFTTSVLEKNPKLDRFKLNGLYLRRFWSGKVFFKSLKVFRDLGGRGCFRLIWLPFSLKFFCEFLTHL